MDEKKPQSHINIGNFQGVLGDVQNSEVNQNLTMNVEQGNFESLSQFLQQQGVSAEEITKLSGAIEQDGKPEGNALGPKVTSWLGNLGTGAAGSLIASAIWKFVLGM